MVRNIKDALLEDFRSKLMQMTEFGLIGFYDRCEVTEVVGFPPDSPANPINIFSVIVFEEGSGTEPKSPHFLNTDRLTIDGLDEWKFGVNRYHLTLDDLNTRLAEFSDTRSMALSGDPFKTGSLTVTPRQFVPPDATESAPLNRVLKNNFRNGSYVYELFDASKSLLEELFEDSRRLQSLSEEIQKYLPIKLASLSDRLGNFVFQLPVEVLMCEFKFLGDYGMSASVAWESRAESRACRVVSLMEFDGVLNGFGVSQIEGANTDVVTDDSSELNKCYLWDEEKCLVLAASAPVSAFRSLSARAWFSGGNDTPRTIAVPSVDNPVRQEVHLMFRAPESKVGDDSPFEYRKLIHKRRFNVEQVAAEKARRFVQYGRGREKTLEKNRGLRDLQYLIRTYGDEGAWLWDPFLNYEDLMSTLCFCKVADAPLYAMASFNKRTKDVVNPEGKQFREWCEEQRLAFCSEGNNHRGLNLQFRCRHSGVGWDFHDRFLIFPRQEGRPLVWSLGTSVNSFGSHHHILQKIDNGELVANAFMDLWDQLQSDDYLVWRCP